MIPLADELRELRKTFQKSHFDLRLVGGCVRDWINDPTCAPHDFDLCTDANPSEQKAIYETCGVHHFNTGVAHGTWTVLLDRPYEITSLRTETKHDGRHAEVSWTRDWLADLGRRDLTINAMAMDFDGIVIDPFYGIRDLKTKHVRFVGRASDRMREDYLRILRFFRFQARFGDTSFYDEEVILAIRECAQGLTQISRERIWSEIAKLINVKPMLLLDMIDLGVMPYIGLPVRSANLIDVALAQKQTKDPVSLMAVYLGSEQSVQALAADWKWSNDERKQGMFIAANFGKVDLSLARTMVAVDGVSKYWVAEALRVDRLALTAEAQEIIEWPVPSFPVGGDDLLALGINGVDVGRWLKRLRVVWGASNFKMNKDELVVIAKKGEHEDDIFR